MTAKITPQDGQLVLANPETKEAVSTVENDTAADIKQLRALAKAAYEAATAALMSYMALIDFVREKQIAPPVLARELKALNFRDSRISEVKAIAYTSDAVYSEIVKNKLGFKVAYEKVKKAKRNARASAADLSTEEEFRRRLAALLEQYVPVSGKCSASTIARVAGWMKAFSLTVNGCVVSITVRRAKQAAKQ